MNDTRSVTVTIRYMEHYAFSRQYDKFHECLVSLFDFVAKTDSLEQKYALPDSGLEGNPESGAGAEEELVRGGLRPLHEDMSLDERENWYHRLATAITVYLSDPTYRHSELQLVYINLFKPTLQTVFFVSNFGSMDHILWHRGLLNADGQLQLTDKHDILYALATHTIHSKIDVDYSKLISSVPDFALDAYIAIMTQFHHPFDDRARYNFPKLFRQHEIMAAHPKPKSQHIAQIIPGWMICTYWDLRDRHQFKHSANRMIKNWLAGELNPGIQKKAASNSARKRALKRIIIASEQYTSKHAMYRCYHSRIEALKENYETILVTCSDNYDAKSAQDFHRVVEVPKALSSINETAQTIVDFEPDLILYPSLGMAQWTIVLCNMRMAPIQVMSYGHPASSFTDTLDYGIIGGVENGPDYQAYLSETLAPQRLKARPHTKHPDFSPDMAQQVLNDGVIRIAVNSYLPKISLRVINLCALIEKETSHPLQFHFFPAKCSGTAFTAFEKSLSQRLSSDFVVHRQAPYTDYMAALAQCDLAIGTFPFGGTNTNVDTLMLGIPKFSYTEASDIASYADFHELKALDLVNEFNSENETQLIYKLLSVINSPEIRKYYKQKLLSTNPYSFIDHNNEEDRKQFVHAIQWISEKEGINP